MEALPQSQRDWRAMRQQVTVLLAQNSNRIHLILAQLILAAFFLPYLLLLQLEDLAFVVAEPAVAGLIGVGIQLLGALFFFLVTLPLISGLLFLAERMEAEEPTALSNLFYAFSSPRMYIKGIRIGAFAVLPLALPALASYLVTALLSAFAADSAVRWTLVALCAVFVAFAVYFALLGCFFTPYAIIRNDRRRLPQPYSNGIRFVGRFLPQLLLAVLTLMIYWIADLLPRMLLTYFRICRMHAGALSHDDTTGGYSI